MKKINRTPRKKIMENLLLMTLFPEGGNVVSWQYSVEFIAIALPLGCLDLNLV